MNVAERHNFKTLQIGRGLAAIMVVLCHVGGFVGGEPDMWQHPQIAAWTSVGKYGVDFFFILSGIVILMAHWNDLGVPAKIPLFFWKRFRRIYPIYWLTLILMLIKSAAIHSPKSHSPWIVLSSIILIHLNSLDTILGPSWTLFHEILFYLLFSMLLYRKDLGIAVLLAWLATSGLFFNHASVMIIPERYASFLFSPLHLLFGFGMLIGWALHHRHISSRFWVFATGLAAFIASLGETVAANQFETLWIRLLGDVGLAVAIWTAMGIELTYNLKFPKIMELLGDASYSIYLSHFMVVSVVTRTFYKFDHVLHTYIWFVMLTAFAVAILIGIAIHLWIEAPLVKLFSGPRKNDRRAAKGDSTSHASLAS
jgi:exopolysaccharide production protein ExoZ